MLELYQFELSQYSEKVRLILDYKGLSYRKIEVTPGIGQVELFQISGQRQVPVLKDGTRVVADSTEIAKYLDMHYPNQPLIPTEPKQRALCLLIEEWADESIGVKSRQALFGALSQDRSFRKSLLPAATPDVVKILVESAPSEVLKMLGFGVGFTPETIERATADLKQDLEALCLLLSDSPYLLGERPTLADFTVASLSILLKFPDAPYLDLPATLRGKGVPGLADNVMYEPFFTWRDRLYAQYRRPLTPHTRAAPTPIDID